MNKRQVKFFAIVFIILIGLIGYVILVQGKSESEVTPSPSPTSSQNDTNQLPANGNSDVPEEYPIKVYFSRHPDSDEDPAKVFAVNRSAPNKGNDTYAINELIKGPGQEEKSAGYFTQVVLRDSPSNCKNQDFTLNIKEGTATLQFCREFDAKGVVSDGQADSQINTTLKQFPTVQKVVILNMNGNCLFDQSGEDRCKL